MLLTMGVFMGTTPKICVSKIDSMVDEKISICITGLQKNKPYTLYSYTTIDSGNLFESLVCYDSDGVGRIDLNIQPALSGSYTGIEPMGIFWSMKCSSRSKSPHARFAKLRVTTPLLYTLEVYSSVVESADEIEALKESKELKQRRVASTTINRWYMAPGTRRIPLTLEKDGILGTLFVPPGQGPFPAVITMFGSHPGTMEYKAALLASHGFAALALAFFGAPGLPKLFTSFSTASVLKIEYFEKAVDLLLAHKNVDAQLGVGLIVLSMSCAIGMAMAKFIPGVKCVVSMNGPTHLTAHDLWYRGHEFPILSDEMKTCDDLWVSDQTDVYTWKGRVNCAVFENSYLINEPSASDRQLDFYNQHDVGFMHVVGLDDANTTSEHYANRFERLLHLSGHHNWAVLRYPGAGHLIEPPYSPLNKITTVGSLLVEWGGQVIPHCRAQEDAWQQQIEFLRSNLRSHSRSRL